MIASSLGANLYPRLGFIPRTDITVFIYERPSLPTPPPSSLRPVLPDHADHTAAIKLDEQATGLNRASYLNALFKQDNLCAVVKIDAQVVAAAWARLSTLLPNETVAEIFIGPVVAKSPDFAVSVTAELLRLEYQRRVGSDKTADNRRSTVLVLDKDAVENRGRVFESLGYVKRAQLPFMTKQVRSESNCGALTVDLDGANSQYYATSAYDMY